MGLLDFVNITRDDLTSDSTFSALSKMTQVERKRAELKLIEKAKTFGSEKEFKQLFLAYNKTQAALAKTYSKQQRDQTGIELDIDSNNKTKATINNFVKIIEQDKTISGKFIFNELSQAPEKTKTGERWQESDDSHLKCYIEKHYEIRNSECYDDAFRIILSKNKYNPIKNIIEANKWDGIKRIPTLLVKWLGCNADEYTAEVTRLIFAGGIHRLYDPGCKFDDMPVLIGSQGAGKSTFVRWLAMDEKYFREVSELEGQKGIEAIQGAWICEVSELLALTKTKEVEAAKAYFSKLTDVYRKPFERRISDNPRQCVFIGTTNKPEFLIDKTGNRRYYPLKTKFSGYDLFNNKQQIQSDIKQCWAEAKHLYDRGELHPMATRELQHIIKQHQHSALEEDWRAGKIEEYLSYKKEVCVIELWEKALGFVDKECTRRDSNDIVLIMQGVTNFTRSDKAKRFVDYGLQRYWSRNAGLIAVEDDGLPF